ncbi:MAG: hypothetical protein ACOX6J_03205 [Oscillospiraceae bacterium]|jgi:phage FluMu protein Com
MRKPECERTYGLASEPSEEDRRKMEAYELELKKRGESWIRCPYCGNERADMVSADASGYKRVKCWKCRRVFVTRLPRFRRQTPCEFRGFGGRGQQR